MGKIYGYIKNKKLYKEIDDKNCCLDDDEIFIVIDGSMHNNDELLTIKKLYTEFGENFVDRMGEFYSVYLYDKKKEILILARDKTGTKPVIYFFKNDFICFSSKLQAIMKNPYFEKEINKKSLSMYFRYHYINPPETVFKNTYKLESGQYLIWKNGKVEHKVYWDAIEKYNLNSKSEVYDYNIAKKQLESILINNLNTIVENSKNVGIYLSSGIDSSLITALCCKYIGKKINTFSVGFYDKERNEAGQARKIAEYLGTNHHETFVEKENLMDIVKKIPKYYDEPFGDASQFPMIILNEFAKESDIKIAITGDGSDELFYGYKMYEKINTIQKLYKIFNPMNIHIENKFIMDTQLRYIYANSDKRTQSQWNIMYNENIFQGLFEDTGDKRFYIEDKIANKNWTVKKMVLDYNTSAVNRYTTKAYNSGSKNEIEIVGPFYSTELVEYAFRIPLTFKYYKGDRKHILKEILYEYIPKDFFSNEKRGFGIPIIKWIKKFFYDDIKRLSEKEFIKRQNIFNYENITKIIKEVMEKEHPINNYGQILWDYYMFQLWYEEYIM